MSRAAPSPLVSWPLAAREIDAALGSDAALVHVAWRTWDRAASTTPLVASWGPTGRFGSGGRDDLDYSGTVWVAAVARADRQRVHALLVERALPDLATWVHEALNASPMWRAMRHERVWHLTGADLTITHDDGMHILDRERGR